ncbi:class I/II aminotransferase (macronuclear) [Tetrahymena thermophila SB210]|uniref:Aspartate aminotransferase n=1 Tax=Tetrahymena thermophila (strain SB210) TaxID=312017 RepID=I7LV29_TETTS|nr:class I/II aminotransferase [Tetrahymena thermophila SB210]EAR96540.1 class I/II aminotransferase [Tetrahymena thermophila SB210]|eukprot:XP_001016785.1 class I/II aminotransferase [Tetrahymena thermophila SB210]
MLSRILTRHFSLWAGVPKAPPDPVLGVAEAFKKDPATNKVNLSVGAYRDDNGKPVVLECVRKAQQIVIEKNLDNEYLPIQGNDVFTHAALKLGYGDAFYSSNKDRLAGVQVLSGTGALRTGFDFLKKFLPAETTVYVPNPTWPNHNNIARDAGFKVEFYTYYDPATKSVNFSKLLDEAKTFKNGSVFILHACAHNPTGCDLSINQWKELRDVFLKKNHIAFMDMAYQGFTSGDCQKDSEAVRLFADSNVNMLLGQSFAKSMGLYGQRIGSLSVLTQNANEAQNVLSQLKQVIRPNISSPPLHGARIAEIILTNPELLQLWYREVKIMADRIAQMRVQLVKNLKDVGSQHDWSHITNQRGMFAYTGVNKQQVESLINDYHIYLVGSGRISIAGLNTKNVGYVAEAFHNVTKNSKV